jgi:hypothetical protein
MLLKAEAMLGAPRVAFLASPLGQRGEDEGEGLEPHNCRLPQVNPHLPLSLRKGEATRCTCRIPSRLTIQLTIDQHYRGFSNQKKLLDMQFLFKIASPSRPD